jgi:hypothetical protein
LADWAIRGNAAGATLRTGGVGMARVTQRDVMRDLNRRYGGDYERVVAAYAAAERRGDVRRSSNVHDMTPEDYARRLYADGVAKGWIP